ncbi:integrase, partial [Rhodobacteraceae bacterium 4F10]
MASIKKHNRGWRAQVDRKGVRKSKVFPTRQQAKDWAARIEFEILNSAEIAGDITFGEMLDRYGREVSNFKRGARWETIRIVKLCRDKITSVKLRDLKPADFADWRDRQDLAPASIIREMQLMSAALNVARKEWGLIDVNPLTDVRRPVKPQPRNRLPTDDEFARLAHSAGEDLTKATARAFHAFLFSCETAMRAGEVCGLEWDRVDLDRRVARLLHTKNGRPRDVPLSSEAVRLLCLTSAP